MKIIIVIGFLYGTLVTKTMAQKIPNFYLPLYSPLKDFNTDTAQYLQFNFIYRKEIYLNNKLEVLLHDLEIPILSYIPCGGFSKFYNALYLSIYSTQEDSKRMHKKMKMVSITVNLKKEIPSDSVNVLLKDNRALEWRKAEQDFYGKQIIDEINVIENK